MTDREINAAVAECCGWKHAGAHLDYGWQSPHWHGPKGECQLVLPDYANDLNAMQAAEELLLADGYLSWDYAENESLPLNRILAANPHQGSRSFTPPPASALKLSCARWASGAKPQLPQLPFRRAR
jgi:hypothetical protein